MATLNSVQGCEIGKTNSFDREDFQSSDFLHCEEGVEEYTSYHIDLFESLLNDEVQMLML